MRRIVGSLSVITCIGMFLVVVMGTLVTQTDSGRGCGSDWPLCNGKFVPAYTIESFIEYSHRFVTGIEGILVLAVFLIVWLKIPKRDARIYSFLALFFTLVQAVLGAFAVAWPQSSAVLALHFGFSLLAFASTLLLAIVLVRSSDTMQRDWIQSADSPSHMIALPTAGFRYLVWLTTFYCYIVVYLGAFVRHTKSSGGCRGWPLCNGEFIPVLSGATGVVFIHRIGALLLFILICFLTYQAIRLGPQRANQSSQQIKSIRKITLWVFYLVVLQVLSGAFVTFSISTDWYLLTTLLHTLIIAFLFGALCYLSILVKWRIC